jgi:hypothetical protein
MGATTASEELADAANVLVLASAEEALELPLPSADTVLLVTFSRPPDDLLGAVRAEAAPSNVRVVAVGEGARSAAASAGDDAPVAAVEHPADLTEIGIRFGQVLDAWDGQGRFLVVFHSVTVLLEHVSVERAFRFLHVLTGQLTQVGAVAHFYLDLDAHDDAAVATVRPLFDAVVRRDGEEWTRED